MKADNCATKVLVTGSAGFIGYHVADALLRAGLRVHGFDGMTDYYDVALKRARHANLRAQPGFSATEAMLENEQLFLDDVRGFGPDVIVHLAAQAGVRYAVENPRSYVDSNIIGTFNVLEAARELSVRHLLIASTSSVYGGNEQMPYKESDKADAQLSLYAATKKANESMAHSYAHLWQIPTTMLRFFTVYGPWGRPDLALFKFVDAIIDGRPIDVYNNGQMRRDFTYIADIVAAIVALVDRAPQGRAGAQGLPDPQGAAVPYRVVNIGNARPTGLMDFIAMIERAVGKKAVCNFLPMQQGDVLATWADTSLLGELVGEVPGTSLETGIGEFVRWFRQFYGK